MSKARSVSIDEWRRRFSYDPETGIVVNLKTGEPTGCADGGGYLCTSTWVNRDHVNVRVHRLAWAIHFGEWPDGELDHINRMKSDNRLANLRIATRRDQCRNTVRPPKPTGLPQGVFLAADSPNRPFHARIRDGQKYLYLGAFPTIAEAEAAYRNARSAA